MKKPLGLVLDDGKQGRGRDVVNLFKKHGNVRERGVKAPKTGTKLSSYKGAYSRLLGFGVGVDEVLDSGSAPGA